MRSEKPFRATVASTLTMRHLSSEMYSTATLTILSSPAPRAGRSRRSHQQTVARVGADTRINRFFKDSNVPLVKERFTHLFCELSGGPCTYLGADMKNSHSGLGISNADFDTVIEDLAASLDKFKVTSREKEDFLNLLRPMRKDIVEKQ